MTYNAGRKNHRGGKGMKKKILSILVAFCMAVTVIPVFASEVNAEVKGSTQYLVNQAKSTRYVGKTLKGVKSAIRAQGYNGWNMGYNYDWCAWYLSNCANAAYVGNYPGMKSISKSTYVDYLANNFAEFNGTTKKYSKSYRPKAGDIVVEGTNSHIGIMVSSTLAAYGNDGIGSYPYTKVKVRKPHNVHYYVPRPNWYLLYYSDGLSSTSASYDMKRIAPKKVTFGKNAGISKKRFSRKGYTYSKYYIYIQKYSKSTGKYTNYYWSKNKKTKKCSWQMSGAAGYTKYKVGTRIIFNYNIGFAGAKVILTPAWVKK